MMDDYTHLVDGEIEAAYNELAALSEEMAAMRNGLSANTPSSTRTGIELVT